jgi:hypothetical protein
LANSIPTFLAKHKGPRVRVLRIWHGARDHLTAEDIETEQ